MLPVRHDGALSGLTRPNIAVTQIELSFQRSSDSVGEMACMVETGKIGAIGLSEVSADTLRKAHATHPIAAVQSEYSLWSRNAEIAVIDACADLGAAFVAFSPVARGFLASDNLNPAEFGEKDIRRGMPRFQEPHFEHNAKLSTVGIYFVDSSFR